VQLLQLCGRVFFDHLIRLCPALLEPHITSGTGWLSALESACDRSLEGAVWLLHALLAPYPSSATATATATAGAATAATAATPAAAPPAVAEASAASASSSAAATGTATALAAAPGTLSPRPISEAEEQAKALASGGGSGGGCWLLSALFDCQSAPARTVIVTFISRLVQRVGVVEVAAANQPASATEGNAHCGVPAGGVPLTTALTQPRFHTTRFVRGLLEVGLPHAAVHWGDAAPFCELIRTLVLLPGPVGVQLAPAWRMHGGLAALATAALLLRAAATARSAAWRRAGLACAGAGVTVARGCQRGEREAGVGYAHDGWTGRDRAVLIDHEDGRVREVGQAVVAVEARAADGDEHVAGADLGVPIRDLPHGPIHTPRYGEQGDPVEQGGEEHGGAAGRGGGASPGRDRQFSTEEDESTAAEWRSRAHTGCRTAEGCGPEGREDAPRVEKRAGRSRRNTRGG
jgi:hypothetical protein